MREPHLTAREVGEWLGVSTETVLRWTRRGELPATRLPGGAIRYRPQWVEAWLEARSTSTGAAVEELSDTPGRARRAREYPGTLPLDGSGTRPSLEAVTNEEEDHAR